MKAIGYKNCLPIEDPSALNDMELEMPQVSGRDILVEVNAISVNPVDFKIRQSQEAEEGSWKVLGWDPLE